ncbi:alkaline phosphatase family protein [Yinghuangia sp. YIM S09857]|uniref:alkaline phosphatase family protein n=1 Tax=Yinghuangia sp. YIM S09857 TaxID=3436929 RepID=UPI003F5377C3
MHVRHVPRLVLASLALALTAAAAAGGPAAAATDRAGQVVPESARTGTARSADPAGASGASGAAHPAALVADFGTEDFDALAPTLAPRVDELGIPADVKGFTHTGPAGWNVAVAPGTPQGVTEWQGWSFTTKPFWTGADAQDRANFTRASGVFAVADPDEWDDKNSPSSRGRYDSTLTSTPLALPAGLGKAYLGFASHYRQEGAQKAEVTVSFDGGAPVKVLSLGPDSSDANVGSDALNAFYSLGVDVPAGARTMTVNWRLFDAGNNWYWAIDEVSAADAPIPTPPAPAPDVPIPPGPVGTKADKVLVIGLDGARLDKVRSANAPALQQLMTQGMTAHSMLYAGPMAESSSGPGWTTLATGVWPDKHGVRDNSFNGANRGAYPDFMTRLETADPTNSTFVDATWSPIPAASGGGPIFSAATDVRIAGGPDTTTAATAARVLAERGPDASYVVLDDIDHAGHSQGADSRMYKTAIEAKDAEVRMLLDAIRGRATYAQENWLVMVTSDHGHLPVGGHGGSRPTERQTFVIAAGAGIPAGSVRNDVRMVDVAATALDHLGVAVDPSWNLDGRPLRAASAEEFDALTPQLGVRVDELLVPTDVRGFTATAPTGWSVDNSRMGGGGTTEWRGWTFATDEFWSATQRDQSRELFVRGRGVFAVADSDEWYDGPHTGKFDSTLVTPKYPVMPGGSATLSFRHHYRHDSGQVAEIWVSYDGAAPVLVRTYGADAIAQQEAIRLQVPAGAHTAQIRFRYAGENNWFWAVDDVRVG